MNSIEDMRNLAYNLVQEANNNYLLGEELAYPILLMGIGIYRVESVPGAGHNYQIIIDAIHKYSEKNPDAKVAAGFEDGIREIVNRVGDTITVLTAFNCICYEAKKQKEGDYSFIINCEQLMTELREKINSNYEEIKNDFIEIDRWIENATSDVEKLYGLKL